MSRILRSAEDADVPCPAASGSLAALTRGSDTSHRYLEAIHLPTAALTLDAGRVGIIAANASFRRAFGPGRLAGGSGGLAPLVVDFLMSGRERQQLPWRQPGVAGRHFTVHVSRLAPGGPSPHRALVSIVDRTAEVQAERALRAEMLRDSLTGLHNRHAFIEAVEEAIADGQGRFAVLAIDLSRFSRINEGVGALAGDELILTVARRLRSMLDPQDLIARTAGDEFGVLARLVADDEDAWTVARRLEASLASPVRLSDLEIQIGCAIGCVASGGSHKSAGDLVGNAQVALKRAKRTGRIEVYQPGEVAAVRRRFSLETELRRAIERDELSLAFQPIHHLDSGHVAGFEALARWNHAGHGAVSPAEFIPVAEESGLIVPLGRWALDRAARTLAEWDAAGGARMPIRISVNVSPVQLARDTLGEAVRRSGIDPHRLTLELTESSIVADPERAARVLGELHEQGCSVAMDDFGTGYSCLAYLQRLPIDILKIDRSLVADMHLNRDSMAIVRAVLSLARALGISATAEGIEQGEIACMLGALGCATGQGFHFARPLPPDDAFAYLSERIA